jgi:hypothetical protein
MVCGLTRIPCAAITSRIAKTSGHQLKKGALFPRVLLTKVENNTRQNFWTSDELKGRRVVAFTVLPF